MTSSREAKVSPVSSADEKLARREEQNASSPRMSSAGSRGDRCEWTAARVWAKLHRLVLDELGSRGDLDWPRCAIDSVNMRALKGGA